MFIDVQSKAVCLLCQDSVAVFKEYDLKRHHQTKHMGFGVNLSQEKRKRKSIELIQKLKKQQTIFTKQSSLQEASTEASFALSKNTMKHNKQFSDEEYLK